MKKLNRLVVAVGCIFVLGISWIIVITSESTADKQTRLIQQASELIKDGIYIRAVPLLEEAAGYNAAHTRIAEEMLKKVYLSLIDTRGISRKYTGLLEKQMNRKDAQPDIFMEAAGYYLGISRITEALEVLKTGIERTGSDTLIMKYESNRYTYELSRTSYNYVSAIYGTTVQVQADGLWGIASSDGILIIPCEYEKISTFSGDRAIVRKNSEIYAVNRDNNRVAKLNESAADFGNYSNNLIPVLMDGVWRRATRDLTMGTVEFEQIRMYSGGNAAAKTDGKWGIVGQSSTWYIDARYEGIIMDELGRSYAQGAVFVRSGDEVYLIVANQMSGEAYQDARPFSDEGYAAVKRGQKWGFIDVNGNVVIDFIFEDALSFGQHLAAVKQDGLWGYISLLGKVVIEPIFLDAKSFSNGSAPVLTERGWQFISLLEYKRRPGL